MMQDANATMFLFFLFFLFTLISPFLFFHLRPAGATCGQQTYGPILWILFTRCTRETWKLAIGGESIDTRYLAGLPMERKYDIAKGKKKFVLFRRPSRHGLGRSCIILEAAGLRQRKFLKDG